MSKETYRISFSGCIILFVLLTFALALFAGLPTFWGVLEIDFFPAAIRLDNITYVGK